MSSDALAPDDVFAEEGERTSVDWEIAFTATVATTVLTFSVERPYYDVLKLAVIGLLVLTLLRRMAVTVDRQRRPEWLLRWSMVGVVGITYVAVIHLADVFVDAMAEHVGLPFRFGGFAIGDLTVLILTVVLGTLGVLVLHELVFGDFALFFLVTIHNLRDEAETGPFQGLYEFLARQALSAMHPAQEVPATIADTYSSTTGELANRSQSGVRRILALLLLAVGIGVLVFVSVMLLFGLVSEQFPQALIAVLVVGFIEVPIQFLYVRYGLGPFPDQRGLLGRILPILLGAVFALVFIL